MNGTLEYLYHLQWQHAAVAIFLLLIGYFVSRKISTLIGKLIGNKFSKHHAMLFSRVAYYGLFSLFLVSALREMGFELTILLGAAGVFTVALSFASQTAASNLISGIFLLFERPFKLGDLIAVKDNQGAVEAIDWLSTKIRTSDNRLVRIPNETLIKSEITNLSVYSQKRDEILLRIEASHDVNAVKMLLRSICEQCPHILPKPAIKIFLSRMIDKGGVELKILYWSKGDLEIVKDELLGAIKSAFEQEEITLVPEGLGVHSNKR